MKCKEKYMYELCLCVFFFKAYVFLYLHQVLVEAWGNFGLCSSLKEIPSRCEGSRPLTRDQTQALCWDCGVLATEPPGKPPFYLVTQLHVTAHPEAAGTGDTSSSSIF